MDNLEYMEAYFSGDLSSESKSDFEKRIISDPGFAEEVAYYISLKKAAASLLQEERERFKPAYEKYKLKRPKEIIRAKVMIRRIWPWVTAAAILTGVIFGWKIWLGQTSPGSLADKYIATHFQTLSVTMGNRQDSLQAGFQLYNQGRQKEAQEHFEMMSRNDTSSFEAKKYAGIISLRLGNFEKAIHYFTLLEKHTELYANPGKFYHAIALLKRKSPGDKEEARALLEQVIDHDLEGKKEAESWLQHW